MLDIFMIWGFYVVEYSGYDFLGSDTVILQVEKKFRE
jgi:hypothetical protein